MAVRKEGVVESCSEYGAQNSSPLWAAEDKEVKSEGQDMQGYV